MLKRYLEVVVRESAKKRSLRYKAAVMALGAVTFLLVVPALLFVAAWMLDTRVFSLWARPLEIALSVLSFAAGTFLLGWSTLSQVRTGKGTPVPIAPPQKLIVTGPYALCRNPIQLGAMLYYLAVGTYFGSIKIGLTMFILGLIIGGPYHKFVEERELRLKFGEEYEEYRKRTPFLIPKLRR